MTGFEMFGYAIGTWIGAQIKAAYQLGVEWTVR